MRSTVSMVGNGDENVRKEKSAMAGRSFLQNCQ
jgi:hypothetical protein